MLLKLQRPWFAPNATLYTAEYMPGEVEVPDGIFKESELPKDCEVLDGKPLADLKEKKSKKAKEPEETVEK